MSDVGKSIANMRAEEALYDEDLWNQKLKGAEFVDLDMVAIDHVSRKVIKARLLAWAQEVTEEFWTEHYKHRYGDGFPVEYGSYQMRIKEGKWTFAIEWFRQTRNGPGGKGKKPISKFIPLPKGKMKHSSQQFPKAFDWEKEIIMKAEDEFKKIREAQLRLKAMMQSVRSIRHLMTGRPEGMQLGFTASQESGEDDN